MRTALMSLIAAGLLFGCKPSPKTEDANAEVEKSLKFLLDWQAEPTYLGVYLAKARGGFARLGLDVEIVPSWGANAAAAAVAEGEYEIATASGGATVIANSKGARLISTAVLYPRLPTAIYGLAEQGVSAPGDLIDKKVGVYAESISKNEFEAFLKLAGIAAEDIELVSISGPDIPVLLGGQADAVLNYFEMSPTRLALERETFQLLLDEYGVKGYSLNVITSAETYARERELIDNLTVAVLDGYRDGCADQPAAVRIFLEIFPKQDAEYVEKSWASVCAFIGEDVGHQTAEGWQTTIDLYGSVGLLGDTPVTPADILPPK